MSLESAKMPSLKDKINEQAEQVEKEVKEKGAEKVKVGVKVEKGRKLNK